MSKVESDKEEQDHETEESDFDIDFKLEPLPCAADIIAELPDYPDSEEEDEVRTIMEMINVKTDKKTSQKIIKDTNCGSVSKEVTNKIVDNISPKNVIAIEIPASNMNCNNKQSDERVIKETKDHTLVDTVEINLSIDRGHIEGPLIDIDSKIISLHDDIVKKRSISPISSPDNDEKPITAPRQNCISPSLIRKSKRQRIEAPKVTEETSDNKVYLNKAGEFFTGFDPASAEAKYRRQMRMQRFGKYEKVEKSKFDDSKLDMSDCQSDENTENNFEKRPEAIHLFGTDDLSTDNILEYFSEFSPHHIEWVDDSHCNVVWSDVNSVKRALLSLSKKFTEEELEEQKKELRRREKDEDDFYLLPGTLERPGNDSFKGTWRVAIRDNHKAHLMFMRIANTGDIKKRGAYKNSRYYSLYGNPNAPFLQNSDYTKLKQNQSKRQLQEEGKKTNQEVKITKNKKPPDLRRYLKKGSIDVEQIKEEYKVGKPLIETLTIEVDRSEKVTDVEVRKDNSESGSDGDMLSDREEDSRTVETRNIKKLPRNTVIVHSSSSSSDSSSESESESSSSSSSSSSDSSESGSSDSSSSVSSVKSAVEVKKVKKLSKKLNMDSKQGAITKVKAKKRTAEPTNPSKNYSRVPSKSNKPVITAPRRNRQLPTKSIAVVRPLRQERSPKVAKLSSQIKTVTNNGSLKEVVVRKKRRGRTPVSPSNNKRARMAPSLDLRAKLTARSR